MIMGIAALVAAGIICAVAVFSYFGGYWLELWDEENDE